MKLMRTVHVMIHGTVQGVWFRANTEKQALKRDLVGWVRNTVNGEVEAVFQGDDDVVEDMIKWCHQGSPLSKVEKVEKTEMKIDDSLQSFKVRYD